MATKPEMTGKNHAGKNMRTNLLNNWEHSTYYTNFNSSKFYNLSIVYSNDNTGFNIHISLFACLNRMHNTFPQYF